LLEGVISQEEYDQEITDLQLATLEMQLAIKEELGNEDIALETRITDAKIALSEAEAAAKEQSEQRKLNAIKGLFSQAATLFNKNSVAYKALASAETLINTIQGSIAAFTGMQKAFPGPVGLALGVVAAAVTTATGLAAIAKINSTKLPKLEEGGVIHLSGPRHSAGGMDVTVGNQKVANVEGGENLVVLKRGSTSLLRNLSNINRLSGGIDFYNDRTPRRHLADGGFVAWSAATGLSGDFGTQIRGLSEDIQKIKIFTSVTEFERVQGQVNKATATSELS
jgi:hypothetical protein